MTESPRTPLLGRDLWVRYTNKQGDTWVSFHRVWDPDLFLKSVALDMLRIGGDAEMTSPR